MKNNITVSDVAKLPEKEKCETNHQAMSGKYTCIYCMRNERISEIASIPLDVVKVDEVADVIVNKIGRNCVFFHGKTLKDYYDGNGEWLEVEIATALSDEFVIIRRVK